ncbi:hypothetical protein F3Y22_tig00111832pilonHSYRG00033 [Hibiscus syriacus]|uniref:Uncharacterized protein n=1 Tax=Hibiscus syriacus TaxID=106335 RepID=A0A6A2YCH5_HIBSY|nr:hypothetical protein F3Y22_tig00111832pilonHSYRG00033 [Hibiscus syriacus]
MNSVADAGSVTRENSGFSSRTSKNYIQNAEGFQAGNGSAAGGTSPVRCGNR